MLKSRIAGTPRRARTVVSSALVAVTALVGATAYAAVATDIDTALVVDSEPVVEAPAHAPESTDAPAPAETTATVNRPSAMSSSSTDFFDFLYALSQIFQPPAAERPAPNTADETTAPAPVKAFPYAVQGDVVDIAGEAVYVCATGNGYGLSHVGATLAKGAAADATRAESVRLCATALRVAGAVVASGGGQSGMLTTARIVESGGRFDCNPPEPGVLRCDAEDGALFTLWDAAYNLGSY